MKYEDLIPTFESKINSLKTLDVESEDYRIGLFEELGQQSTETKEFVIKSFENFPEIYADIVSASDSPNCACRGRVASFFQENPGIALDIFKNILNKFPQDEIFYTNVFEKIRSVVAADNAQNIDPATIKNTPMKSLNGRVISITNSSQEYFKVIQSLSMQGYKYNGISVVENNDNLKLYFY
jgi:hypothetical protein